MFTINSVRSSAQDILNRLHNLQNDKHEDKRNDIGICERSVRYCKTTYQKSYQDLMDNTFDYDKFCNIAEIQEACLSLANRSPCMVADLNSYRVFAWNICSQS